MTNDIEPTNKEKVIGFIKSFIYVTFFAAIVYLLVTA